MVTAINTKFVTHATRFFFFFFKSLVISQLCHACEKKERKKQGSLQSLDWTGGLDWWTGLKIIFYAR